MDVTHFLSAVARKKASGGGGGGGSNVDEAFFGGGTSSVSPQSGASSNVIDYFDRTSTSGNATDRGDLTVARRGMCGVHDGSNGFWMGANSTNNVIDYVDITTTSGNATDVGDCNASGGLSAGVQGSTYGYKCGGTVGAGPNGGNYTNAIEYITLATTSQNGTDKGDLTNNHAGVTGVSGDTYGFVAGGAITMPMGKEDDFMSQNTIDYFDTNTTSGNSSDKGDLSVTKRSAGGVSGASYGFFCGGSTDQQSSWASGGSNVIDYIDITTQSGNATDRGDLTASLQTSGTDSNGYTNGIVGAGSTFDYFDVTTTTGNGTDRGDRSVTNLYHAACSN